LIFCKLITLFFLKSDYEIEIEIENENENSTIRKNQYNQSIVSELSERIKAAE
jgi:hypothetical protein